jgi:hypothetical protein
VKTIEDGSVDRLDTSCVAKMERPAFVLSLGDPEVPVSRADLELLVGSYGGGEDGLMFKVDLVGERLRLEVGSETHLLVPTAATRFRPEGMPVGYVAIFERDGGGPATAMVVVRPGQPDERLVRKP